MDGYHGALEERPAGKAAGHRRADRLGHHTTGCSRRWILRAAEDIAGVVQGVGDTVAAAAAAVRAAEGTIADVPGVEGTGVAAGLAEEGTADDHLASLHRSFAGAVLPEERHRLVGAGLPVRHKLVDAHQARELRSLAGEKESHRLVAGACSHRLRVVVPRVVVPHVGRAIRRTGWEQTPGYESRIGCRMTDARKFDQQVVLLEAAEGKSWCGCQQEGSGAYPCVMTMALPRESIHG